MTPVMWLWMNCWHSLRKQKTGRAVQDNKDKMVDVAKPVQKLAKELCATKPQDKAEENFSKEAHHGGRLQ